MRVNHSWQSQHQVYRLGVKEDLEGAVRISVWLKFSAGGDRDEATMAPSWCQPREVYYGDSGSPLH
jgi:hypothetical protein